MPVKGFFFGWLYGLFMVVYQWLFKHLLRLISCLFLWAFRTFCCFLVLLCFFFGSTLYIIVYIILFQLQGFFCSVFPPLFCCFSGDLLMVLWPYESANIG